jgi:eukaryotic-like serine/threonine-protein kinase
MATQQDNREAVKALFAAALEENPADRSSFLKERCSDASVCAEVERLLAEHDEAKSFLRTRLSDLSTASMDDHVPDRTPTTLQLSESQLLAGRFRIVSYIAGGGMGDVYEAEDQELRERVAVKTIRPEILAQPNAMARFKREVQLARKVTHPNVCRIFDLFRHKPEDGSERDEIVFISMELLRGETLGARLKERERMSVSEALPLIQQMASALAAAHEVGIVHRDFKPGNVVLVGGSGQSERAVVTDFGLARQSLAPDEAASLSTVSFATGQGFLGTPAYMAPEQLEGQPATNASDIYALGLVVYEMITGEKAFVGENHIASAFKRLTEPPRPPRGFAPDLSPACESVILRCLARDPAHRFANAREVATALAEDSPQTINRQAVTVRQRPLTSRFSVARISAALILVVLAAASFFAWRTLHPGALPLVAVAGFKNSSGDSAYDWLATELTETLTADLNSSTGIQTVPTDELARVRTEYSIAPAENLESDKLAQVRQAVGANYLLVGSYSVNAQATEKLLTLDLRLEGSTGKTLRAFHGSDNETDYGKLVTEVAAEVLGKLGTAGLPEAEVSQVQNLYPSNPEARKRYFEALDKLRSLDAPAGLLLLNNAEALEPNNVAIHSALADAWSQLKHDPEAAAEAKTAAVLADKTPLPLEYTVLAHARADEMAQTWDAAIKGYSLLFPHYQQLNYGLRLASVQLDGSQPRAALDTLNQLAGLRPPMNTDPRIEIERAQAYAAMSDFAEELRSAQRALTEAENRHEGLMKANAEIQLCWAHRSLGHVEEAYSACNEAQNLFSAFGDNVSAAVALNDVATWLLDRGNYAEAKQLYDRVIQVNRQAGAKKDLAGAYYNAAKALELTDKPEDAEDYIKNALEAALPIGDKYDEALARILRGKILAKQGHPSGAEKEVKRALTLARDIKNQVIEATALSNLAQYQAETDSGRALDTYREALLLRQQKGDEAGVAICLTNMGDVLFRRGNVAEAEESYQKALQLDTQLKDKEYLALDWVSLAEVDLERGRLREAQDKLLSHAIPEFRENKDADFEVMASSVLVRVLVAEKDMTSASAYVKRIQEIASKDQETEFNARLSLAEYLNAMGKRGEAINDLASLPTEAKSAGMNFLSLKARLAILRIQIQIGGRPLAELRKEATSIKTDAQHAGFGLLLQQAKDLRL